MVADKVYAREVNGRVGNIAGVMAEAEEGDGDLDEYARDGVCGLGLLAMSPLVLDERRTEGIQTQARTRV